MARRSGFQRRVASAAVEIREETRRSKAVPTPALLWPRA